MVAIWVLRCAFLLVAGGVAVSLIRQEGVIDANPWVIFCSVMIGALAIIGIDVLLPRKRIDLITSIYFGIVVGLFLTYLVGLALEPMFGDTNRAARALVQSVLGVALS